MRLFVALWPPEPLARELDAWLTRSRLTLGEAGWRATSPGQCHLTLAFLGEVPEARVEALTTALNGVARNHPAPRLRLAESGMFPSTRQPRVLWIGLAGELDRLAALHQEVSHVTAEFRNPRSDPPFHPHLTLARRSAQTPRRSSVGSPPADGLPGADHAAAPWDRFRLVCSDLAPGGARYRAVAEMPLVTTR